MLDIDSPNPAGYDNRGAALLETIMSEKSLIDKRRDQLGLAHEFTRAAKASADGITSTRLDRWYTPEAMTQLQTFEVRNDFIFKERSSDHLMVVMTLDDQLGERGKDRISVDPALLEKVEIQDHIKGIVDRTWATGATPQKNGQACTNSFGTISRP
jgi:hypothetical protein